MGAAREDIARHLSLPVGTLFSLLTRIAQHGLSAIEDRRRATSQFLPVSRHRTSPPSISFDKQKIVIDFGADGPTVKMPAYNSFQVKTFLLTLLHNDLLSRSDVASLLGYSADHTARLAQRLADGDVHALLDKREGQKKDYRVTADVKAELVQQFAVDAIARGRISSTMIAAELKDRCNITIPARTVRHHLANMGLPAIKHSLPQLLADVKRGSSTCS
jgi:hypothetical protein